MDNCWWNQMWLGCEKLQTYVTFNSIEIGCVYGGGKWKWMLGLIVVYSGIGKTHLEAICSAIFFWFNRTSLFLHIVILFYVEIYKYLTLDLLRGMADLLMLSSSTLMIPLSPNRGKYSLWHSYPPCFATKVYFNTLMTTGELIHFTFTHVT